LNCERSYDGFRFRHEASLRLSRRTSPTRRSARRGSYTLVPTHDGQSDSGPLRARQTEDFNRVALWISQELRPSTAPRPTHEVWGPRLVAPPVVIYLGTAATSADEPRRHGTSGYDPRRLIAASVRFAFNCSVKIQQKAFTRRGRLVGKRSPKSGAAEDTRDFMPKRRPDRAPSASCGTTSRLADEPPARLRNARWSFRRQITRRIPPERARTASASGLMRAQHVSAINPSDERLVANGRRSSALARRRFDRRSESFHRRSSAAVRGGGDEYLPDGSVGR